MAVQGHSRSHKLVARFSISG